MGTIIPMRYIRRILENLVVVWAVATLAFFALRLGRVDPLASLTAQGLATQEQAAEMRRVLGLDRPLLEQYAQYFGGVLRGDLGRSIFSGQDVAGMIAEAAGYTVPLAVLAWLLAVVFGIGLGAAASRRDSGAGAPPPSSPGRRSSRPSGSGARPPSRSAGGGWCRWRSPCTGRSRTP